MNGDEDASGPLTTRIGPDEVLQGHFFGRQIRPSEGTWGVPRSGLTGSYEGGWYPSASSLAHGSLISPSLLRHSSLSAS